MLTKQTILQEQKYFHHQEIEIVTHSRIAESISLAMKQLSSARIHHPPVQQVLRDNLELRAIWIMRVPTDQQRAPQENTSFAL